MKLVARSCPKLRRLILKLEQDLDIQENSERGEFDFDNDGLCALPNACIHLREVNLSRRSHIGDTGVVPLGSSLITDLGLEYLANGVVINCFDCLAQCGVNVTNSGILALSKFPNIEFLDLSWLINASYNYEGLRAFVDHPTLEDLLAFKCHNLTWEDVKLVA
ncbi:Leucine-rich repeat, cysteine-containing subtype [Artemisia annua]|uniref:Leucine-rich repeat, cysteine-containing subtype n=1 Tax=Artemisia annua TaxID=35608 RepID=A0A2U1PRA8_ARTAN|nr:Leucine-rich repeat, cysteine-containing subtype [Artemisia annua]